jgi:putative nucleotidyltransferase with HDIG domain
MDSSRSAPPSTSAHGTLRADMSATSPAPRDLRVLCLEDSPSDAELVRGVLSAEGYELEMDLAAERGRFEQLLAGDPYDVILADYRLPGFDARAALELAKAARPQTPFVCISATIGEEVAVELLKGGAVDLVLKERMSRLPFAVQRAIDEKAHERQQQASAQSLAAAALEWSRTFDAMPDSVAVLDGEGRVLRCNAATAVLTTRGIDDIVGRSCYEVFHGTGGYHADCPQRRAFASGQVETSILQQNGGWLRDTFTPQLDAAGRVLGGVHVVTNVSELKRAELSLLQSLEKQRATTEGVIAALAQTVDVRDPHTAGHQRRVSALAMAIAQHLGLGEESVRGLRVAGMLHDVGKIVIPAEILSKPGRLSDMEYALIKGHSRAAYEILESIDFDFPVAEVVCQHHERLDGSGYPAGLVGDAILPEARILAVADVVEAMISHRPYRAALPLETVIAELENGAGGRYEAAACEVAIRLFREQAFGFSE